MREQQFLSSSRLGLFLVLQACLTALCAGVALDCVNDVGGAVVDGMCYVFSSVEKSCTTKCDEVGTVCNEPALAMDNQGCLEVITALGIDLSSSTWTWYFNFGSAGVIPTLYFTSSRFDENIFKFPTNSDGNFRTLGCVVSPTYDASDQDSFTTGDGNINFVRYKRDELEAHNFDVFPPTCDLSSPVLRRVCACTIATPAPTPSPTIAPTPHPTLSPTPHPVGPPTPSPTPPPTLPLTPAPSLSNYSPSPLVDGGGYWRTRGSSSDVRACPIPDLCEGGTGGGDDVCFGNNTGPYCMVCPSSYFASVNGVCLECGSAAGVTTVQVAGFLLSVFLLLVGVTLVGPCILSAPGAGGDTPEIEPLPLFSITAGAGTQQSALTTLRQKLVELGLLVACLRRDLTGSFSHQLDTQLRDLLVTIEMFLLKLIRELPRVPESDPDRTTKKAISNAQLLCPVIDQLAAGLAGLSGATPVEATTVIQHVRSVLATARALGPSAYLRNVPTNDAASVAKVLVSFVQIMATTPMALVVRHSDSLRSFLGGVDIANFSAPKALSLTCLIQDSNFYGELVFKIAAPLVMVVVIFGAEWIHRLRAVITKREGRGQAIPRTECLLALTYLLLTPATNAALRGLPCETFDDGTNMLRADYSIDCDAAGHGKYRVLALTMAAVYPFSVLAFYSFVLWRRRQLLYPTQVRGRPREDKAIAEEAKQLNELALRPFAILHDAYEPRAWWFEIFETFRRICLTSLVYFAAATTSQLWMAMLITVVSLAMNVVYSPFAGSVNDYIYSAAQYVTLVVLALALTVDAETDEADITSEGIGWAIVVLVSGYIIVALAVLAAKWKNWRKAGRHLYAAPRNHKGTAIEGDERENPARAISSQGATRAQEQSLVDMLSTTNRIKDDTPAVLAFSSLHGNDEEGGEGASASRQDSAHVGKGRANSTPQEENLESSSVEQIGSRRRLKGSWKPSDLYPHVPVAEFQQRLAYTKRISSFVGRISRRRRLKGLWKPRDLQPSTSMKDLHQRLTRQKRTSTTRRLIPINTRTDEALSDRSNPYDLESIERETDGLIRWEATTGSSSSPQTKSYRKDGAKEDN